MPILLRARRAIAAASWRTTNSSCRIAGFSSIVRGTDGREGWYVRRSICAGLLAAALGLAGSGAKAQNLVGNGSFETVPVPVGRYTLYTNGQRIGPWTAFGPGNVGVASGTYRHSGFTFNAQHGLQWLDLTGTSNTPAGVYQTVNTFSPGVYELSFYVGNVYDPGGIFGVRSTVSVFVAPPSQHLVRLLMTAVNSDVTGLRQEWNKFSGRFGAGYGTTIIYFRNGDGPNDGSCGLDNVSLVRVSGP